MPRSWSEVAVDDGFPLIYTSKTKNRRPKRPPLPWLAVYALRQLPSYGRHEYMFPARANVKFRDVEKFSRPHAWNLRKRFRPTHGARRRFTPDGHAAPHARLE